MFELSVIEYFVCCICIRLVKQRATWYVTAPTVPQMLEYQDSITKGPCACGCRCYWWAHSSQGQQLLPVLLAPFLLQIQQTWLYKALPMSLYPHMPSSSTEGIAPVLCLSIRGDA